MNGSTEDTAAASGKGISMYEYDRETGIPTNTETGARLRYLRGEGRMGDYRQFFLFEKPDLQFEVKIKSEHGERQVDQFMPEPRVMSWEDRKAFMVRRNALESELNYFHSEIEDVATRKPLGLDLAEDMMRLFQVRFLLGPVHSDRSMAKRCTVGFRNNDPNASWKMPAQYLMLDYDGSFKVDGKWDR